MLLCVLIDQAHGQESQLADRFETAYRLSASEIERLPRGTLPLGSILQLEVGGVVAPELGENPAEIKRSMIAGIAGRDGRVLRRIAEFYLLVGQIAERAASDQRCRGSIIVLESEIERLSTQRSDLDSQVAERMRADDIPGARAVLAQVESINRQIFQRIGALGCLHVREPAPLDPSDLISYGL
jgi:hypothetical protein